MRFGVRDIRQGLRLLTALGNQLCSQTELNSVRGITMWRLLPSQSPSDQDHPGPRSSHSLCAVGRTVYLFGGEKVPRVPVDNHMYGYDLDAKKWNRIPVTGSQPVACIAPSMAPIGTSLYVFGGRTGVGMGEGVLDCLHRFDTTSSKWEEVDAKGDIPEKRSFHAVASNGEKIFIFGGCGKDRLNDLHCFDPSTATWEMLPSCDLGKPRGGAGLVHADGALYVIAGFIGEEVNDMYRYDIASRTWTEIKAEPNIPAISVFGHGCLKHRLLIFGGEVKPSSEGHAGAGSFSNMVYEYACQEPERGWRKAEVGGDVPSERGWLSAALTADDNFVVYGGNDASNERLADLYALTF